MKNESKGIRKEVVVAKFHVLSDINLEKLMKTDRNISHDSMKMEATVSSTCTTQETTIFE
jgi:hypothetical protein